MPLFGFKSNTKTEKYYIDWQGHKVNLNIRHESRKDSRVSITKSGINVRLPILLPEFEKKRMIEKFIDWAKTQLDAKPHFYHDKYRQYQNGEILELFDKHYRIVIKNTKSDVAVLQKIKDEFIIEIPLGLEKEIYHKTISKLIQKKISHMYKPIIWKKLNAYNNLFNFGELKSLRMKNNSTNWGSCSNKGNINISVRLLLCPEDTLDYVLIHELAHLNEQNHGANFWKLVEKACPAYETHEKKLKIYAKKCVI